MKAVFRAGYPIPEIGVESGDLVFVRPGDPVAPLQVVKQYGHHTLCRLMGSGHLDRMTLIRSDRPLIPLRSREPLQQQSPPRQNRPVALLR